MAKILWPSVIALTAIVYALFFSTTQRPPPKQPELHHHIEEKLTNPDASVEKFARLITFPTLADRKAPNHISNPAPFQHLLTYIKTAYPTIFSQEHVNIERINEYSMLINWPGTDPTADPVVLMSHYDVVPAPEYSTGPKWTHPPFDGTITNDGFIYGRGTLDTKITFAGILEAVEQLLKQGYSPERSVLIAFGHDEEVGGNFGAKAIVDLLAERNTKPVLVLDEGGYVLTDGIMTGDKTLVDRPVAVVGTAEKGYQTWKINVQGTAGHSSRPPTGSGNSVAARLARILSSIEKQQMSTNLQPPALDMLRTLGPYVKWAPLRTLLSYAQSRIVKPAIGQLMGNAGGELAAMVKTTVAVVGVTAGGEAQNIIPGDGSITINFRLLQGDNETTIREYLNTIIRPELPYASIEQVEGPDNSGSPVASAHGPEFDLLRQAIQESLPGKPLVVPYLVIGMTDSRWYNDLAPGKVYKFSGVQAINADAKLIHGVDERVKVTSFLDTIRFFMRFIKLAAGEITAEGVDNNAEVVGGQGAGDGDEYL